MVVDRRVTCSVHQPELRPLGSTIRVGRPTPDSRQCEGLVCVCGVQHIHPVA